MESLRTGVRRLFNKSPSDKNPHSWDLYRQAQRNYREVRKASKNAWRGFCSSIDDLPRSARLHRALSRDPKIKLGSLVAPTGRRTQSKGETLELLLITHFPQLRDYTGVSSSCSRPPGQTPRLDAGYESGHLQKGRMGYRFLCPI